MAAGAEEDAAASAPLRGAVEATVAVVPVAASPEDLSAATDPIVTGAVPPVPGTNSRAARTLAVDTSDPESGFIAGNAIRRTLEGDPYAPLGIRVGRFVWYPSVGVSSGYTTNSSATAGGSGAGFAIVAPELLIRSDWARHAATLAFRGSYETFTDNSPDDPAAEVEATGRIDFADRWTGDLRSYYRYGREGASDPNSPAGVDRPADTNAFGGAAALNGALGRNVFTLEGTLDRSLYGSTTAGGAPVDQGDRDNTLYGARLRLGYPLSGAVTPFVEGLVTRRQYDDTVDDNGLRRSSTGEGVRIGLALDRGPVTTGEIAFGYRREDFDDAALRALSAFTVDGSLVWSPTELTTVTTRLATTIDPSTDAASSGSIIYDGSVDLAYAFRRNATANLTAGVKNQRFEGTGRDDWTYTVGVGTVWKVNRGLELAAGYVHEWLESSVAANDYTADTIRFDLRFRR